MTLPGADRPGPTETSDSHDASGPAAGADVRIVVDPDPRRAARRLAAEHRAEVVEGSVAAEDLVRHRLSLGVPSPAEVDEAVRLSAALEGFDAEHDQEMAATVAHLRPAVRRRPPNAEDLARLRRLDDELVVLAQIRERTEARSAEDLAARLGIPNRFAVPAEEVRRAAARRIEAEARVAVPAPASPDARRRLAASSSTEIRSPRRPGARVLEAVVVLLGIALATVVVTAGLHPALAGGPVVIALVVAFVVDRHSRRVVAADTRDRRTALETLTGADAGARSRDPEAPQGSPEAMRDLAGRQWAELAGDADPHQVEQWLAAQQQAPGLSEAAVRIAPAVQAAGAAHRRARADWRTTWAGLGHDAPEPHSEDSGAALRALAAGVDSTSAVVDVDAPARLASAEVALARVQGRLRLAHLLGARSLTELQSAVSDLEDQSTVVLVEPFTDLGVRRAAVLRRQLRQLRHADRVVAVVADPSHVPAL